MEVYKYCEIWHSKSHFGFFGCIFNNQKVEQCYFGGLIYFSSFKTLFQLSVTGLEKQSKDFSKI